MAKNLAVTAAFLNRSFHRFVKTHKRSDFGDILKLRFYDKFFFFVNIGRHINAVERYFCDCE